MEWLDNETEYQNNSSSKEIDKYFSARPTQNSICIYFEFQTALLAIFFIKIFFPIQQFHYGDYSAMYYSFTGMVKNDTGKPQIIIKPDTCRLWYYTNFGPLYNDKKYNFPWCKQNKNVCDILLKLSKFIFAANQV